MPDAFAAALAALPEGGFTLRYGGRRYAAAKTVHAGGRSVKLTARALDGSDRISLNWYDLPAGPRLRPCEMPAEKVRAFVAGAELVPDR